MEEFKARTEPIQIEELSDMANQFINKIGQDWGRFLVKVNKAKYYHPKPISQIILDEAIDILRPHLDRYNTPERMVGEELWKEIGTYMGLIVE